MSIGTLALDLARFGSRNGVVEKTGTAFAQVMEDAVDATKGVTRQITVILHAIGADVRLADAAGVTAKTQIRLGAPGAGDELDVVVSSVGRLVEIASRLRLCVHGDAEGANGSPESQSLRRIERLQGCTESIVIP